MVVWVLPLIPFPTGTTARWLFQLALGHPPMGIRKAESGAGYAALGLGAAFSSEAARANRRRAVRAKSESNHLGPA